ncbi:MAG TPA: efflux RND transporter periplasmic adaptor subunit [Bradyrhizobium sp.]|nr:efflux RND transporter periplasmic adaptor subunit [Bradyrhizobium sp.]
MPRLSLLRSSAAVLCLVLPIAGCGDSNQPNPAAAAPAPAVTVVKVTAAEIKPATTFTGRIEAKNKVDLRVRVDGFLEKRLFDEGMDVKEGELLFVIEKGLYQAAVDQAKAALETAQSTLKLADLDVDRQTQLLQRNVVAQATLDQVTAKQGEARGNMLAQKAALEKAELQLSYTDIKSPISGRIGRASVSVGNFVSPSNSALATIVSQDPIYASFPVTQREMLAVRKQQAAGKGGEYVIYVQLADGSRYASPGKIDFLDNTVNQGTDTVQVRALFANPDRVLVDGQLVTVVAEEGKGESALLAPQQALQVDQTGPYVLVVDKDNKIQIRRVETDVARGANIVVRKGLAENELIVTEGIQRVRPGQVVAPTEAKPGA